MIGDAEADAGQLRLKPLLNEGEEKQVALSDSAAMVAILQTTT